MFAARQRAGCVARQLRRTARTYASEAHGHHKAAEANESFGKGSIYAASAFFGTVLFIQFVPAKGEESAITNFINKHLSVSEDWAEINAARTKAEEQAAYDKNLFQNGGGKQRYVDISFPEAFQSHAPRNIQAGQLINLDHVVEHYRTKSVEMEERKAQKLAQKEQ